MNTKNDTVKVHKDSGLTENFVREMKDLLIAEKDKLEQELGNFTKKNPHVEGDTEAVFPEYGDEMDENAREIADYITNKSLEEVLEKKLRDIIASLKRIEEGTYGVCKYTGKPIGEKRLRARPTSSTSIEAKKFLTDEA